MGNTGFYVGVSPREQRIGRDIGRLTPAKRSITGRGLPDDERRVLALAFILVALGSLDAATRRTTACSTAAGHRKRWPAPKPS